MRTAEMYSKASSNLCMLFEKCSSLCASLRIPRLGSFLSTHAAFEGEFVTFERKTGVIQ